MDKKRTDIINHLIQKYGLKRYLEIGLQNADQNFNKIQCEYKISVDPDPNAHATFCMTSDKFFTITDDDLHDYGWASHFKVNGTKDSYWSDYEIIFLDGLHTSEQIQKDFENALKVLAPNGWIVLHDCCPEKEEHTIVPRPTERGHWNGDVYKFACKLSANKNYWTVNEDNGCGVYRNDGNYKIHDKENWTWSEFQQNKKTLLNLISYEQFLSL